MIYFLISLKNICGSNLVHYALNVKNIFVKFFCLNLLQIVSNLVLDSFLLF